MPHTPQQLAATLCHLRDLAAARRWAAGYANSRADRAAALAERLREEAVDALHEAEDLELAIVHLEAAAEVSA